MSTSQFHKVNFTPNPVQKQFIESQAKADLMSSRMGEGKSTALAWAALYHTRHNPGAAWLLVRDTFENMVQTTQKTFFQWFPPGIFGTYHAQKKEFTWASGIAEGTVGFSGMDDPADASKLMSRELAGIGMDEPAPATTSGGIDELVFDLGMSRLRQSGMKWYSMKLAENNPDETHWSFRKFSVPGTDGYSLWQPATPENAQNLPPTYYNDLRKLWGHRPDLLRRFVEGEFGFQQVGSAVTPQWNDKIHLAVGLNPLPRWETFIFWDFGHNPSAVVCQKTPMHALLVLDCMVGDGIGVEELIADAVRPLLVNRYPKCTLSHIGDPAGNQREQGSILRSAVRSIKAQLGGRWQNGPVKFGERVEPLRALLTRLSGGKGQILVDRERAAPIWHALRGGWHFHVARSGVVSGEPVKNIHSHPGDALSYGVARLFPMGRLRGSGQEGSLIETNPASYFGRDSRADSAPVDKME